MQNNNSVAEFLIELIKYADDEDIAVLLSNCNNKLTQHISVSNYKTALFNYLFEYIYAFIEPKLPTLPPLLFKDNKIIRVFPVAKYANNDINTSLYEDLYLHLYALCECYNSYQMIFPDEKKEIIKIANEYNKIFNENIKINTITYKDKTKLLHLLINSYTENKFYYYFYNDTLTKVEIIAKKIDSQLEYFYNLTKYELIDTDKTTFITNNKQKINAPLKQKLVRKKSEEIDINDEIFQKYIYELIKNTKFQTVKNIHQQIVSIIKKEAKIKYCKCCNPNPKNINAGSICKNCRNLIFQLNILTKSIDDYEINDFIYSLKSFNFKQFLCDNKSKKFSDIKELCKYKRRILKHQMAQLIKNINNEMKEKMLQEEIEYLNNLANIVKNIEPYISKSFPKK